MPHCPRRTLRIPAGLAPDGVATSAALRAAGVSSSMITNRCRYGGPWQRLLPGVILLGPGPPSRRQLQRAAVSFVGDEAVITADDALRVHGVNLPSAGAVRLLVPGTRRVSPRDFVATERTGRMPVSPLSVDGLAFAPPARAAIDAARNAPDPGAMRSRLALPVLHGLCGKGELVTELESGNQRGSSAVRAALRDFDATLVSVLHSVASELLAGAPLPEPRWNVTVTDRRRRPIGYADAWWEDAPVAWLLGPMNPTPARLHSARALAAVGVTVIRTRIPALLRALGDEAAREAVLREVSAAFLAGARATQPAVEISSGAVWAA